MRTLKVTIEEHGEFYVEPEHARSLQNLALACSTLATMQKDEEATFPVYLTRIGNRSIATIKEIRTLTGVSPKVAKRLHDR